MWSITKFNPVTHDIEMKHLEGDIIKFTIPLEHQVTRDLKLAYIEAQTKEHIFSQKISEKLFSQKNYILIAITAAITIIIMKVLHGI